MIPHDSAALTIYSIQKKHTNLWMHFGWFFRLRHDWSVVHLARSSMISGPILSPGIRCLCTAAKQPKVAVCDLNWLTFSWIRISISSPTVTTKQLRCNLGTVAGLQLGNLPAMSKLNQILGQSNQKLLMMTNTVDPITGWFPFKHGWFLKIWHFLLDSFNMF